MLINSHTTALQQWQQKQKILNDLHDLANLPITADPCQRELTLEKFFDFINQQCFDSLYGGLLIKTKNVYNKPLITNLYAIEVLIAANNVFYQGYFLLTGQLISQYVTRELEKNSDNIIKYNEYFERDKLCCFFSQEEIELILEKKEQQLLLSLTSSHYEKGGVLVSYCRSLNDAAKNINMHYKEAQILEFSLNNKLKNFRQAEIAGKSEKISNIFSLNCTIISSFTSLLLTKKSKSLLAITNQLFQSLYLLIGNQPRDVKDCVNLLYSGVLLLQVNFDTKILSQAIDLIELINSQQKLELESEEHLVQLNVINSFINALCKGNNCYSIETIKTTSKLCSNKVSCIFLAKEQINTSLQVSKLRSKFNPYQLIYIV